MVPSVSLNHLSSDAVRPTENAPKDSIAKKILRACVACFKGEPPKAFSNLTNKQKQQRLLTLSNKVANLEATQKLAKRSVESLVKSGLRDLYTFCDNWEKQFKTPSPFQKSEIPALKILNLYVMYLLITIIKV